MSRLLVVAACLATVSVISAPAAFSAPQNAAPTSAVAGYDAPNYEDICELYATGNTTFSLYCGTGSMGKITIHGRASCTNEWNVAAPARTADLTIWADRGGYVTGRCPSGYRLTSLDGIHPS